MAKPIHTMLRVLNEDRSVDFYRTALGLEINERLAFDSFTLLYLANPESPFELELTVNHGRTDPYETGTGYGHLAVSVPDLDAEHTRLTEAGLTPEPIKEFHHNETLLARFFFLTDPDGYRIEVLQRHGRFQ